MKTKRMTRAQRMDALLVATTDAIKQHKARPEETVLVLSCLLRAVLHKAQAPHADTVLSIMRVLATPLPKTKARK